MATNNTNILLLPVDILVNIFRRLNVSDLSNVMLSCKTLNDLVKNYNTIWRRLARNKLMFDLADSSTSDKLWYNRCRTSHNWRNGCYKSKVVLQLYTKYMPWLTFHNSEILLVSVGSELLCFPTNKGFPNCREPLWKVDVPIVKRHDVRTNDISRFVLKNNYLACGNRDGCTALYRFKDTKTRPRLQYHIQDCHGRGQKEVTAVEMIDGGSQVTVITGSQNSCELRFCALKREDNPKRIYIFRGDETNIFNVPMYEIDGTKCMALNKAADKLAIGPDRNSRPVLLDVNNPRLLLTAEATRHPKQAVRDIQWHDENTILYVTHSGILQMIDIRTYEVVYSVTDPFQSTFYCVKSDGRWGVVAGAAEYSRCVLFDSRVEMKHIQMYFTQRKASPVYSLDFDPYRLITAVDRGVAVVSFNIGASSEEWRDFSHVFN